MRMRFWYGLTRFFEIQPGFFIAITFFSDRLKIIGELTFQVESLPGVLCASKCKDE